MSGVYRRQAEGVYQGVRRAAGGLHLPVDLPPGLSTQQSVLVLASVIATDLDSISLTTGTRTRGLPRVSPLVEKTSPLIPISSDRSAFESLWRKVRLGAHVQSLITTLAYSNQDRTHPLAHLSAPSPSLPLPLPLSLPLSISSSEDRTHDLGVRERLHGQRAEWAFPLRS